MKRSGGFSIAGGVLLSIAVSAFGQSVVEYSTTTAAGSSGAAASGQGISKSIGGIFGNLNKSLGNAKETNAAQTSAGPTRIITPSASSGTRLEKGAEAEPAKGKLLLAEKLRLGIGRAELVERFGSPFMKTSRVDGVDFVETYYYQGTDDMIVVTIREGKVTSISPPPVEPAKSASAK